jgi:hypothetical protein
LREAQHFVELHRAVHTMAEFQGLLLGMEQGRLDPCRETVLLDLE